MPTPKMQVSAESWLLQGAEGLSALSLDPDTGGVHVFLERKMNMDAGSRSDFSESRVGVLSAYVIIAIKKIILFYY